MPVISSSGSAPKVVVVQRRKNVAAVTARTSAVKVPSRESDVGTVVDRTKVVNVASPGPQGPKGEPGTGGGADPITLLASGPVSALRVVVAEAGSARYPDTRSIDDAQAVVGITRTAGSDGEPVTVQSEGELVDAAWNWAAGSVWCGADGALTQVMPATGWLLEVGRALSATRLLVDLQTPLIRS